MEHRRLPKKQICPEVVRLDTVGFLLRTRQHDDRGAPQPRVGENFGQDLTAVLPGEEQVEKDQIRSGGVGILPLPPQVRKRLCPIPDDVHLAVHRGTVQGLLDQPDVAAVIFHQ